MDPNEALRRLSAALRENDLPAAAEIAQDLEEWIHRGGFPGGEWLAEFLQEVRAQWERTMGEPSLGASEGEPVDDVSFESGSSGRVTLLRGLTLVWIRLPENQAMQMAVVRDRWKRSLLTDILYPTDEASLPTLKDVLAEVARQALVWEKASQSHDAEIIERMRPYSKSSLGLRMFICDEPYAWLIREAALKA